MRWLAGALLLPLSLQSLPAQGRAGNLTIFAASSLTEAFKEIGAEFEKSVPGVTVRFNFAGSQQLAAQLELAGGADVFASGDRRWMDAVREKSLVQGEPLPFASNTLVVILPRANPAKVGSLQDLAQSGVKLVLAAPAVPAGRYCRDLLQKLAGLPGFVGDYAERVLRNVVSNEESVRGVLGKVLLGEADAGIVYRSDVTPAVADRLAVLEIPDEVNVVSTYLIAVLRESRNPQLARRFLDLVLSQRGQAILARHGFLDVDR